ncbi:phage head closure protein [Bacteroides neonati]|uniref:phage head closure protein n=1 Tax=Bacteroides neonati TaxID=1347393 RepID=UPI0004AEE794|nr:phage head closure protein [Bacteroides neonati]
MRAGLLRELLVFKELKQVQSNSGAAKKEYVPILTCKAYRKKQATVVDRDGVNAMEQFTGCIIVFQTRYYPVIKENQRVEYQGRDYSISLLDKQGDNTYLITLTKIDK